MYHKVNPPYLKRGLGFLKNHLRVDQDFLVKNEEGGGGGNPYRTGVSIEGREQCFPLMMYGFYSDHFLYSVFHLQYLFFFYLLFIPEIVIDLNQVSAC